jgi:hypothetical protein
VLLGSIVEVALEAPPLGVLCTDETLPGCLQLQHPLGQLRREADIPQHQARLDCQIGEQLLFARGQPLSGLELDRERTQQLVLLAHLRGGVRVGQGG